MGNFYLQKIPFTIYNFLQIEFCEKCESKIIEFFLISFIFNLLGCIDSHVFSAFGSMIIPFFRSDYSIQFPHAKGAQYLPFRTV